MLTNLKNIRVVVRFYFLRKSRLGYYEKSQTFQGHEAVNMSTMVNFVRAYHTTAPTCAVFNIIPRVLLIQLISSICGGIRKPRRQLRRPCPIHFTSLAMAQDYNVTINNWNRAAYMAKFQVVWSRQENTVQPSKSIPESVQVLWLEWMRHMRKATIVVGSLRASSPPSSRTRNSSISLTAKQVSLTALPTRISSHDGVAPFLVVVFSLKKVQPVAAATVT
jgi:hypothetical protein